MITVFTRYISHIHTPKWRIFILYSILEYVKHYTLFWSIIYIMYGQRIRELRVERGLSQSQLAVHLNTSQKNISKYELELLDLSTDMIIKLCAYFGVTAGFLLGIED